MGAASGVPVQLRGNQVAADRDKSAHGFSIGRTNQTTLQIAMNVEGKKYAGGRMGSLENMKGLSWEPTIDNGQRKMFKVKWRYQKQQKYCQHTANVWTYLDVYRWVPKNTTGGNRLDDTTFKFGCGGSGPTYNDYFGSKTSITNNSAVRFAGWFSIAGVTLDAVQHDTDYQSFWIDPDSGVNAKACGSNNALLYASLAKEVKY